MLTSVLACTRRGSRPRAIVVLQGGRQCSRDQAQIVGLMRWGYRESTSLAQMAVPPAPRAGPAGGPSGRRGTQAALFQPFSVMPYFGPLLRSASGQRAYLTCDVSGRTRAKSYNLAASPGSAAVTKCAMIRAFLRETSRSRNDFGSRPRGSGACEDSRIKKTRRSET